MVDGAAGSHGNRIGNESRGEVPRISQQNSARIAFAAALLFSLISMTFYGLRTELYPALTMPPFPGHPLDDGIVVQANQPSFVVLFRDGTSEAVAYEEVTPSRENGLPTVFPDALRDPVHVDDPRTVEWLKSRIDSIFPGRRAEGVSIEFATISVDVTTGAVSAKVVETIDVNFTDVR